MKKIYLTFVMSLFASLTFAQGFIGLNTDNYGGLSRVYFNPANAFSDHVKLDINIVSAELNLKNVDQVFEMMESDNFVLEDDLDMAGQIRLNAPSAMFPLGEKSGMAIYANANMGITGTADNELISRLNTQDLNFNQPLNADVTAFGWAEYGLSYAREVIKIANMRISAGVTLKLYQSMGCINGNISNLNSQEIQGTDQYVLDGSISYRIPQSMIGGSDVDFNLSPQSNFGMGLDIGVRYEFLQGDEGDYFLRADLALVNLGSVSIETSERAYSMQTDNILAQEWESVEFEELMFSDPLDNVVEKTEVDGKMKFKVPTLLNIGADLNLGKGFFVNASSSVVVDNEYADNVKNYLKSSIIFTPRFEKRFFGAYLPVGKNQYGNFITGLGLRAGPFFVGSSNFISDIVTKGTDNMNVYFGFRAVATKRK